MSAESVYLNVVSGRSGVWAAPIRLGLGVLSLAYGLAVRRRNALFDRNRRSVIRAAIPVVSVGNITTGGTGKTPLVIEIVQRLGRMGRTPAVVARGYKAIPGQPGDEVTMLSERLPGVACIASPDRSAGVAEVVRLGADVAVLDDGFQHRRLARDLDIVLIDATNPFGFGRLLPAGLLREPLDGLARAGLIVITRAGLAEPFCLGELTAALERFAPGCPVVRTDFRSDGIEMIKGDPSGSSPVRAFVTAGVGNPSSVLRAACDAGHLRVGAHFWPDHHVYTVRDIRWLNRRVQTVGANLLLTTHKDVVKLRPLIDLIETPVAMISQSVEFLDDGADVLENHLDEAIRRAET